MATGSPPDARASTLNTTSAQYRSSAVHLEKGSPLLLGNEQEAARARWGQKPHREANSLGREFIAATDPAQTNELSHQIAQVEKVRLAKTTGISSAVPPIYKYMYLARDQEWRGWASDEPTRTQCDQPSDIATPFPLRVPPDHLASPTMSGNLPAPPPRRKFARAGEIARLSRLVTREIWETCSCGIPAGMGIANGMIRNRRDVLCAPVVFTILFLGVTWVRVSPIPCWTLRIKYTSTLS